MTATGTSAPPRAGRPARAGRTAPWRLLLLELRRSPMLWVLPLLAVLLALTEVRNDLGHPPLWPVRSADVQVQLELIGGVVAGMAAWVAGRDGRRGLTDLVATAARPRWARQLAAWLAVAAWAMLLYAASVGVVFAVTARQATAGDPIWWLPGVGAAAIVAFSAVGFAVGSLLRSRFAAPLVAFGAILAPQAGVLVLQHHHPWGRVSPVGDHVVPGTGILFPFHPGLSIVQIIFLAGVTAMALGAMALPRAAGGTGLRRVGALLTLAGLAATVAGVALADTARLEVQGAIIPALDSAAGDRPISYQLACARSGALPVCLPAAYRPMLAPLATVLKPVLSQVAGLPGAPIGVQLGPVTARGLDVGAQFATITGHPPVIFLSPGFFATSLEGSPWRSFAQGMQFPVAAVIISAMIDGRVPAGPGASPAQQAITAALEKTAGISLPGGAAAGDGTQGRGRASLGSGAVQFAGPPGSALRLPAAGSPAYTAGQRFAALPATVRHAWLAAHLTALRVGRISLAEIP